MTTIRRARTQPTGTGIGLRSPHVAEVMATRPAVPWFEVHAENYMADGPVRAALLRIRELYPLSLHGVGLSLGSAGGIDRRHLRRLKALIRLVEPVLVSEHLAWSVEGGTYLNDLLPVPGTAEALAIVCENVSEVQEALGRSILIENPSAYFRYRHSPIPEPEFLAELVHRTGCGLLCDVNNIAVSAHNLGFDPVAYIDALPADAVHEIHLAGHCANEVGQRTILIDHHGAPVADSVWRLYAHALRRFGPVPTLIEWDTDLPGLDTLLAEAAVAERVRAESLDRCDHAQAA
jgi:uncharacterized protein (UPF0276 family)